MKFAYSRLPIITRNPELNKEDNAELFPEKMEKAHQIIARAGLPPVKWEKPGNSDKKSYNMDVLTRLQDWYKINCDGDWEHSYGMSLTTLDNPGWHLIMNLSDTALRNLQYAKEYQNKDVENDWFHIKVENQNLQVACGPSNLSQVMSIFFDDIIPNYSDNSFLYEVYLPMTGHDPIVWTPAQGKMISENTLELVEVPPIKYSEIKLRNLNDIDFTENDMHIFNHAFKVGDPVLIDLEDMFDGVKLVAKTKI